MDLNTAAGEKVVYIDENGYDYDKKQAREHLTKGQILTVASLDVGQSSSTVRFEEFPNVRFNTVMFKNATPTWERFHWFAYCYMGVKELTQEDFAMMSFDEHDMSAEVRAALPKEEDVYTCVIHDLPNEHSATLADELVAALTDHVTATHNNKLPEPDPVKNIIMTLSRGSGMQLGFINPDSEEAAQEAFMEQFGYKATATHVLYCGATFDPSHVSRYSNCCDC